MKQLIADMDAKRTKAMGYMDAEEKDVDKALALLDEADGLEKEYEAEKRLAALRKEEVTQKANAGAKKKEEANEITKAFLQGVRTRFKDFDGQREGSDADGGYIVPKDVVTQINEFKREEFSLLPYVDYQRVTTNIGSRTYESKATATSFDELDEAGTISQIEKLKFQPLTYHIKNYGGFLPVSNQLLQDTDAALQQTIAKWFARKSVATANKLILAQLATNTQTNLVNLDGIKRALNVTLGQAYKSSSIILTNDDGLDYLDTLKDKNDRYILQPNPSAPAKMQIRAGATIVPLLIAPNNVLKTDGSKIPFIIGDLYEAVVFWSREQAFLNASNVASVGGVNAWAQNLTLFKSFERNDVTVKDKDSFVYGYISHAVG